MPSQRLSKAHLAIIILLVIHLLPVWVFTYFPTQDGSSHVYNAYVLKDYHKQGNDSLREVYQLNLLVFPNWASHLILAGLLFVFPPLICEKILVSICILLLPIALFYFLNAVHRGRGVLAVIGLVYGYNYLLHMGFYNFALSMPLFFFALGYWWRRRLRLTLANIVVLYGLLIAIYLCHYQSYALLLLSLTFFAAYSSVYDVVQKRWGYRDQESRPHRDWLGHLREISGEFKPALLFLGSMLPAYFIMLSYYLANTRGFGRTHKTPEQLREYFLSMKSLVAFRDDHILIGRILLATLAVAFLLALFGRIRAACQSDESSERRWTKIVDQDLQFVLMAVVLTVLFFKMPYYIHSGGAWINDRIHIYIFLVLLPFFSVGLHRYVRHAIAGMILILSLWHLGLNSHTYYHLSRDIGDMVSSGHLIAENAVLDSRPSEWGGSSDSFGQPKYVAPFLHLECYLGVNKGVAYLKNYEAEHDYFPINYRNRDLPADYLVLWRTEYGQAEELAEDYDLIRSGSYNRLYRRRQVP